MTESQTLYDKISGEFIRDALTEFYKRAFSDPIIGHFFFNKDREHITAMQIDFVTGMLGGPKNYRGKPIKPLHEPLRIRNAHFNRRQVLMGQVLTELKLEADLAAAWLDLEEEFRPIIVKGSGTCHS